MGSSGSTKQQRLVDAGNARGIELRKSHPSENEGWGTPSYFGFYLLAPKAWATRLIFVAQLAIPGRES
jgi:hypothetical protein